MNSEISKTLLELLNDAKYDEAKQYITTNMKTKRPKSEKTKKDYNKKYYETHKAKVKEITDSYRKNHRETYNEYMRNYHKRTSPVETL